LDLLNICGFSLHRELALLVQAGLTPMEALRSATADAAVFLNKQTEMGTIQPGKIADLVLLDANPLDDIHNTSRISAVFVSGNVFLEADIQAMLERAAKSAASVRE
jgi:imidazolonepropionase-like amidohydrolase